jgi:hypothetical protein
VAVLASPRVIAAAMISVAARIHQDLGEPQAILA